VIDTGPFFKALGEARTRALREENDMALNDMIPYGFPLATGSKLSAAGAENKARRAVSRERTTGQQTPRYHEHKS
jgi:hypothetical protein